MPLQRQLNPHEGVLGARFVDLECVFTMGSGGAVSAVKGTGFATSDWTDNGTGDFTVQLPGTGTLNIYRVLVTIEDSTASTVALEAVSEANRTITFLVHSATTPALRDPTSGAKVRISIRLKESAD